MFHSTAGRGVQRSTRRAHVPQHCWTGGAAQHEAGACSKALLDGGCSAARGGRRNLPAWKPTYPPDPGDQQRMHSTGKLTICTFISLRKNMKTEQLQHSQCLMSRMRFPLAQSTTFIWKVGLPEHDLVLFKNHC